MLSFQTVVPNTLELLKKIAAMPSVKGMRLVGGTSLALQLGHRQSIDLDFFSDNTIDQESLLSELRTIGDITVLNRTKSILQLTINNIKVDFVQYNYYKWIDSPVIEEGIIFASPKDIAAMKINAVMGRGSKKDFIDIYILLQHFTLKEILNYYKQKYPEYSEYRALLSLTYFEDADYQTTPRLFFDKTWEEMKHFITASVTEYQSNI